MPRLREVPRAEVHEFGAVIYDMLFGDRDPVAEPGPPPARRATGGRCSPSAPTPSTTPAAGLRSTGRPPASSIPSCGSSARSAPAGPAGRQFVFSQHCKAARDAGLTDEQVDAVPHWQVADCFSPVERAVLAYTDALVLQHGRVPDGVFDLLKAELSEVAILELTYVTGTYVMHAITTRALRLEFDDVDDPCVEVPDPEGNKAGFDVMAVADVDPA